MKLIINKILPITVTNEFKGKRLAYYVFILITILTIGRSLVHILALDGGAQSIAGIPLDTFSQGAQQAVILIFALWGSSQFLMGIVYTIVLAKYKSLIPLMYLLIFLEYSMRIILGLIKPISTLHIVPGSIADYIIVPLALIMLYLSLKD